MSQVDSNYRTAVSAKGRTITGLSEGGWFLESLNIAGLLTGAFAVYSLFRPLAYRLRTLPQKRQEARSILQKHGTSSLDFFKLYPEKSYFFSGDRTSFIEDEGVHYWRTRRVQLITEPGLPVNIDGELVAHTPKLFSVAPKALRMVVPRADAVTS